MANLLLVAVNIAQAVVNLFRPTWTRFRLAVRLGTELAELLVVILLLRAGNWVMLTHPNGSGGNALFTINTDISYGLWIIVSALSIAILIYVWRLIQSGRKQAAPIRAQA